MKRTYSFALHAMFSLPPVAREIINMSLNSHMEFEMTEAEFNLAKDALGNHGIELMEVCWKPFEEWRR